MLARSSKFFEEMLADASCMGEGKSKDQPLCLDGHGAPMEWYALFDFLYPARYVACTAQGCSISSNNLSSHDEEPVVRNQAYWISVLSISHKYEITGAFRDAKHNLLNNRNEPMSHTLKLNLGL